MFFSIAVSVCQRVLGHYGVNLMGEVWDNLVNYGISSWDHLDHSLGNPRAGGNHPGIDRRWKFTPNPNITHILSYFFLPQAHHVCICMYMCICQFLRV